MGPLGPQPPMMNFGGPGIGVGNNDIQINDRPNSFRPLNPPPMGMMMPAPPGQPNFNNNGMNNMGMGIPLQPGPFNNAKNNFNKNKTPNTNNNSRNQSGFPMGAPLSGPYSHQGPQNGFTPYQPPQGNVNYPTANVEVNDPLDYKEGNKENAKKNI